MVWVDDFNKDDMKKAVYQATEIGKKWNILTPLVGFPILISFFVFGGVFPVLFGQTVSKSGNPMSNPVTEFEYGLALPGYFWLLYAISVWIFYTISYFFSKRNKVVAYKWNLLASIVMMVPIYYSIVYGFQFFVPLLGIRIFLWLIFIISVIYLFYYSLNRGTYEFSSYSVERRNLLLQTVLVLWGIHAILNFIFNGFDRIFARLLLSGIPLLLLFFTYGFTKILSSMITSIKLIKLIEKNQEHYREEFGYSIEAWYGKKSRQYKKWLKENI
ncbi:Uncharacterised protein [Streptococcus suis]|uniref:Uncharacterized protein n=2 Tax=Streptococcus suis TaxID=1307 RepID=A0A116LHU4_STRSU|nr:Uncharacterised protein [Streptococcus suis]CYU93301.1 Uncharacterised protein [Streptococcus suis]CYV20325.1 Uncharacterised protein [Streptococcus suis]CYV22896.1 Uncharacterised protein [Streptococcus suis]CYV26761.1 Uncharacterised protein [Streptococcus suis]